MKTIKTDAVIFRKDLYPRLQHDQAKAQQYAECVELLPPIELNQNMELIDGKHRLTAHQLAGVDEIAYTVTETRSDVHLLALAIERNAAHGLAMNDQDKRQMAIKFYADETSWGAFTSTSDKAQVKRDLAAMLKCSKRAVEKWVSDLDRVEREARQKKIEQMYFQCYTTQEIADAVGLQKKQASDDVCVFCEQVRKSHKVTFSDEQWKPPLFDIWSFGKKSNEVGHFGNTEQRIVENLLYLYTEPLDIVVDPFGGGGSTLDVCVKRGRRCWISDRKPKPGMEEKLRTLDIVQELPSLHKRWSEVSLVYLDPPYWKQAEGEYSNDPEDLANQSLDEFTKNLSDVVKAFGKKIPSGATIALIIQPTHWRSEPKGTVCDRVIDTIQAVASSKDLQYERRFSCPYSTEQATPQMVDWSKENRNPLVINRELIVWRKK